MLLGVAAARAIRVARALGTAPLRLRPARGRRGRCGRRGAGGTLRTAHYSRALDIGARAAVAVIVLWRCIGIYNDIRVGKIWSRSERLVRIVEFVLYVLIAGGAASCARSRHHHLQLFTRHVHALDEDGDVDAEGAEGSKEARQSLEVELSRACRVVMCSYAATAAILLFDFFRRVKHWEWDLGVQLLSATPFSALYLVKVSVVLTFVFHVRWLTASAADVLRRSRYECEKATATRVVAAWRGAGRRLRRLRAAAEHVRASAAAPLALCVLLLYLDTITTFFHLIIDLYDDPVLFGNAGSSLCWIAYHSTVLHLTIQPCYVFTRQDVEMQALMYSTLQRAPSSVVASADFDIMWDQHAIIRATTPHFVIFESCELTRELFLSISGIVATFVVILVHVQLQN